MIDNTDYLISLLKQKETIPDSGSAYSDATLINYLDMSMKAFIVPTVESIYEEHFVVTMDVQMPAIPQFSGTSPPTNVGNVLTIPSESTGYRLRDVYMIGSDGTAFNLERMTPTQAAAAGWSSYNLYGMQQQQSWYGGFYLQGNTLQLFPYGIASNKLMRMTYERCPADLALVVDSGKVVTIIGDVLTLDTVQPTWVAGTSIAISSGSLPHDYVIDATIPTPVYGSPAVLNNIPLVNVAGNILTLPTGLGANVQVGDYVSLAGYSVFAQNIPKQLYPALVQKAAAMCIHAAGDSEGQKIAEEQYLEMIKLGIKQLSQRVQGKPITVLPTNSPFKASRSFVWGRY